MAIDVRKAVRLLETGCNSNDSTACETLADRYHQDLKVQRDLARALQLYARACDGKIASACVKAGDMYRKAGRMNEAQRRYEQGCGPGGREGCPVP